MHVGIKLEWISSETLNVKKVKLKCDLQCLWSVVFYNPAQEHESL